MTDVYQTTQPLEASPPGAPNGAPPAEPVAPVPLAPPAGPVIGKRLEWFPRKGDHDDAANTFRAAYPGFHFEMWVNYPQRLETDLMAADDDRDVRADRIRRALKQIVLRHNGWRLADDDGAEVVLPPPTTDDFWDLIPNELATAMMLFVLRAASSLPNSMLGPRSSSRRG